MPQTDYILDKYVMVTAGQPYRLLPFGRIYRAGRIRDITPEVAATFKLPHFKPPIKLGSHEDTTPAGGFIVGLEVRQDGLYAITEMNPEGITSLDKGAYRYHSPEIIWEDGGIEDATNGNVIPGPIIMGDALLHDPALGEAAALYQYQHKELTTMADETVQVPVSFFDKFLALLKPAKEQAPEPEPQMPDEPQVDQFAVVVQERDQLKAEIDALKAEKHHAELLEAIHKEFDTEEFGASYIELGKAEETALMLAGMTEEQRAWVLRNFKALSAQIKTADNLEVEVGNDVPTPEGRDGLDKMINDYAVAHKVAYDVALMAIRKEQPELFK